MTMGREILSVRDAVGILGGTEKKIRSQVARGILPYRKLGGRIIFIRHDLLRFLEGLPGVPPAEAKSNLEARNHD